MKRILKQFCLGESNTIHAVLACIVEQNGAYKRNKYIWRWSYTIVGHNSRKTNIKNRELTTETKIKSVKPFLRWAGGKTWFIKHIGKYIPEEFDNYYEPLVGGGSVFFYLKSKGYIKNKAYLSDSNAELINTYKY